ncbi:MAG: alpha/beta hydrolase, partial [Flavobacteriales bacterium]|nr:alpha/beta hydrolase [Flavobacteriales bacterium]
MKNRLQFAAVMIALLAVNISWAQTRYLDEVFTDEEITITSNVVYATNIDFLTSDLTPTAQLSTDIGTLSALADAGADYPAPYFDPGDASTQLKVTDIAMDVYHPDNVIDTETERPVIVYFHTGNFLPPPINGSMMGQRTDSLAVDLCKAWARRGYVAVSIDYRLGWNPIAPDVQTRRGTLLNAVYRAIQDAKMAVRTIKTDATTYGADVNKIALFGEGSGGYMSQAYTTLDNPSVELFLEKFLPNPFDPSTSYIDTTLVGPPSGFGFQNSLNLYRDNGVSAEVHMSINAGGALADESWLEAGDVPMVSFHAVRDDFAPFTSGTVIVPTTQEEVVDVHGSNFFIQKANDLGNNDVFAGLPDGDPYTDRARSLYNNSYDASNGGTETVNASPEGLFSIVQPLQPFLTNISAPWQWWDPSAPLSNVEVAPGVTTHMAQLQSNPNMSEMQSDAFQDTINGFMLPRLACALDLPNNPCSNVITGNNAVCDAAELTVDAGPASTDNSGATGDGPQGSRWDDGAQNDIWFTFVAPAGGAVEVETFDTGDNGNTQVAVHSSS